MLRYLNILKQLNEKNKIKEIDDYAKSLKAPESTNTIEDAIAFLRYHSVALSVKALDDKVYEDVASQMSQLMVKTLIAHQDYQVHGKDKNAFFTAVKAAVEKIDMSIVNQHHGVKRIVSAFIHFILMIVTFGGAMKEKNMFNTATKNRLNLFSLSIDKLSQNIKLEHSLLRTSQLP